VINLTAPQTDIFAVLVCAGIIAVLMIAVTVGNHMERKSRSFRSTGTACVNRCSCGRRIDRACKLCHECTVKHIEAIERERSEI